MKKILFFLVVAVCAFTACDPTHEDISNDGHITLDELLAKTTVTTDKAASGLNGNVISCETLAPVVAMWDINGEKFKQNSARKKMRTGEYSVMLTALCADGTVLTHEFTGIKCEEITQELQRFNIYPRPGQEDVDLPFKPGAWNAAAMRFSDSEGQHFPFISDAVYKGKKVLILDVSDVEEGTTMMVHNGWWSATYYDDMPIHNGQNEIRLTEQIYKDCSKDEGCDGKDLQFLVKSGNFTVNSVYYEE